MVFTLVRFLHLAAMLVLAGSVVIQNMATGPRISRDDVCNLARVNRVLGLSAAVITVLGLLLWFSVGKPAAFYNGNPLFHAKLGLVVVLAALSSVMTSFLRRHRLAGEDGIAVPRYVRLALRAELVILLIIPALAYLMARGIGMA